jgi:glycosyltransferase involved in cell wall biosynthesis
MNFCFVSTMRGYSWGGSELLWAEAATLAAREGHLVTVVTHPPSVEPSAVADLRTLGARVLHRPRSIAGRLPRIHERLVGTFATLANDRPDLVVISIGSALDAIHDLELIRFLERSKVPYLALCQHCLEFAIVNREHRTRALRFYRGARKVAFVAEGNRRSLEQMIAGEIPGAVVVRNPLNLSTLEPVAWPDRLSPVGLACVARLDATYKGQDVLFEALAGDPWRSRNWTLRLYGEGPHRDYLADQARFRGLEDRTEFRGHVSDIHAVWSENHLALFPSRSEGTPLALVEAMACGRPAVVSDVGGNAEWVDEPRNGMIAEAPTARSFGAALERAWQARADWPAMGLAARQDALDRIDPTPGRTLLELMKNTVERSDQVPAMVGADQGGGSS